MGRHKLLNVGGDTRQDYFPAENSHSINKNRPTEVRGANITELGSGSRNKQITKYVM